jgi:hypothetical protein
MRFLSSILYSFFICAQINAATKLTGQIHDIDLGTPGEEVLVFLGSGDVLKVDKWNLALLEDLNTAKSNLGWMSFTVSDERIILKASPTKSTPVASITNTKSFSLLETGEYIPTTIESMELATAYMKESRQRSRNDSQCFNRAMVWTYEWWMKHSLRSNKVFVFWTKEYVREKKFKWWFHVAPYVHVLDTDGVVKERVVDVKFQNRPYTFQDWADFNSTHDVKCKVVEKYSDYADYPFGTEHCYFMRTNMYTWQPADIEMKEVWGYKKESFHMEEVRAAYLDAFGLQY